MIEAEAGGIDAEGFNGNQISEEPTEGEAGKESSPTVVEQRQRQREPGAASPLPRGIPIKFFLPSTLACFERGEERNPVDLGS